MSLLSDPVNVLCAFQNGQPKPLVFKWQNRRYPIQEVVFQFKTQQGSVPILVFSCQTKGGVFDLTFNLKTLVWKIRGFHEED